ncbi:MAG: AAA family ATPase [Phycisphaerales bacterium]|jgi:chromosome partitioning protein
MRTIAIVNQKGGCGKTTTAISLSGALAARGKRVLLVDMDPQSHCAAGLAIPEAHIEVDVGDAMLAESPGSLDRSKLLWRIGRNLDLLPSRMKLAGLEASRGGLASLEDKEQRLAKVIAGLEGYDLAIIDCSPSIGLLTYNALCAADEVLIPVETSYFAQQGASRQVATLRSLGQRLGRQARHWIVPTIHEPEAALPSELLEQLRSRFGSQVCQTVIHKDDKVKEAATFGRPVGEYAPQSQAAQDYAELAEWVLNDARGEGTAGSAAPAVHELRPEPWTEVKPAASGHHTVAQVAERARRSMELDAVEPPNASPAVQPPAPRSGQQAPAATSDASNASAVPQPTSSPSATLEDDDQGNLELERLLLPKHGSEAFGIHPVAGGVWLVQPIGLGRSVAVAGEFNAWSAQSHRFNRYQKLGVHARKLELPPGRHAYRLVVDGFWTADPFNPDAVTNPFGEPNSIAEVSGPPADARSHERDGPPPAA